MKNPKHALAVLFTLSSLTAAHGANIVITSLAAGPSSEPARKVVTTTAADEQAKARAYLRQRGTEAAAPHIAGLSETVPEVGGQTALTVVAELGDVRRFRSARAVTSYAGIAPRVANSADTSHHGRITKKGNAELRWALNQAAVRLLARHPLVRRWAAPHLRRLHKNKVRTMLARRLLVGIYIVLSRGEVFSLERCLGVAA